MEAVIANISLSKSRKAAPADQVPDGYRQMAVYIYNIAGVTVMLHASVNEKKGKFTCSEYFTGYAIRYGETMQEALDNTAKAIGMYTDPSALVAEKIQTAGMANQPAGG